MDMVTWSKLNS